MSNISMMNSPEEKQVTVSRRTVLGGAVAAGAALAFGGASVLGSSNAFAAAAESTDFLNLSVFLTGGQPLAAGLAKRYEATLNKLDPGFKDKLAALQTYVAGAKANGIDDLLERPDLTAPLKASIAEIVSAWYLGIVNNDTDVELVAYADALMYRSTIDVIVVPSYGGGPGSWGTKPPALSLEPNPKPQPKPAAAAAAPVEVKKS